MTRTVFTTDQNLGKKHYLNIFSKQLLETAPQSDIRHMTKEQQGDQKQ